MTSASSTSLSSATGCSSSAPYLAMAALLMSTSILPVSGRSQSCALTALSDSSGVTRVRTVRHDGSVQRRRDGEGIEAALEAGSTCCTENMRNGCRDAVLLCHVQLHCVHAVLLERCNAGHLPGRSEHSVQRLSCAAATGLCRLCSVAGGEGEGCGFWRCACLPVIRFFCVNSS